MRYRACISDKNDEHHLKSKLIMHFTYVVVSTNHEGSAQPKVGRLLDITLWGVIYTD